MVDEEVRRIVDGAHAEVTRLITDNRDKLDSLTEALLRAETLDEDDAYRAAGVRREPREEAQPASIVASGAPPASS